MIKHQHRLTRIATLLLAYLLSACSPSAQNDSLSSVEQALSECQASVDGATGINAKSSAPQDAAAGYTISGFVLTSCMEKHRFRCSQPSPSAPCNWIPI